MHHMYPLAKGDPLCPLGFHPQVRWPTRCKRCFRDYKEHGGKRRDEEPSLRRDDTTASTPSLSWSSRDADSERRRSWVSSSNLASDRDNNSVKSESNYSNPSSWTSTPDLAKLEDDTQAVTTVSIKLPKRKQKPIDTGQRTVSDSFSIKPEKSVFSKNDSLAARARKLQQIKEAAEEKHKRIQIKEVKTISEEPTNHDVKRKPTVVEDHHSEPEDDAVSIAGTETTDTTLVDAHDHELREQLESLKKELETTKTKCERLEREKSDILLRRLAAMETTTSKTTASEVLKLQQKCNELQQTLEDFRDEKKSLTFKVKELEEELEQRPTAQAAQKIADELRSKLLAAETLCEELMDENEDIKKELRDMEEQMDEMQDNFREDQAVEYTSLKKELDQTTKNCRILSFKLRKAERKTEQLEQEKNEAERKLKEISGGQSTLANLEKMKQLEQDLKLANEVSIRLQKELDETNQKLQEESKTSKKKAPKLGSIGKFPSADGKVSRESLTRGGSQDDPAQLLRDLQDSMEREADLREQLKFAEEEICKKSCGHFKSPELHIFQRKSPLVLFESQNVETKLFTVSTQTLLNLDSSEAGTQAAFDICDASSQTIEWRPQSFISSIQFHHLTMSKIYQPARHFSPMATFLNAMGRKLSPTNNSRLTPEPPSEKGDVSDDEDPAEIKLQLELSEQEASVLRRKVEDLEAENHRIKTKNKELQDKLTAKTTTKRTAVGGEKGTTLQNQKLKVLEDEANDLRKKLIEKERDCERLHAELSLNQKRSKSVQKSKSLDLDQQTLDLKRQLQVIEQEASILRNKIQSLEAENEKLISENKKLQLVRGAKNLKSADKNLDKYIDQIASLEIEISEKNDKIKALEEKLETALTQDSSSLKGGNYKRFVERTPKKVSQLTSKDQLKTMVHDLENEIGEMIVAIKTSENEKIKLEEEMKKMRHQNEVNKAMQELEEMNKKFEEMKTELSKEKEKVTEEKSKYDELNKSLVKTKESLTKSNQEKKKLKEQIEKSKEEQKKVQEEKDKLDEEIAKLKANLKTATYKQDELTLISQKAESLKLDLDSKEKELKTIKKELDSKINELSEKASKVSQLERKFSETEEKLKIAEKREKDLEAKIEEEKSKTKSKEGEQSKWNEERKKYNNQIEELNNKILSLETTVESKKKLIERLEENLKKERESFSKVDELETREITKLKDELSKSKANLADVESKLASSQKSQKNLEDKLKKSETDSKNDKLSLEKKKGELEIELQNEKKKIEVMKGNHEKENKNKEMELASLKSKIKSLELNAGAGTKRLAEIKQFQETIDKLETNLNKEKQKYEDLTAKYEILEEEHVVTKAKLVMEKETIENQLSSTRSQLDELEVELKTLRETYNKQHDEWIKEKLSMQEKIKEIEKRNGNGSELDKVRYKAMLDDKQSELDQLRKENEAMHDQMEYMRKETDELRKKLDDYEKVNKVQRNISADSSAMEKEIRQLKAKLSSIEKSKKLELGEYKMRYDNQLSIVNGELQQLQGQVMRFKRERDTYKHMLESAQKTIGDLKNSPRSAKDNTNPSAHYDELEESKTKIATLEQQISCMEDELSEARLECSRLKTELVSERSTWEVKMSELHSRVNELEEEKILSSGRTKIVGLRTRMELAWQKEREEQQRLLQETATLARDLRQTLFEVERERDKERLEAKRKQEQFKKSSEEDQDENKKKITELQCDLLELRDAHAKLRTTNEKLRREKERYEKEREEFKSVIQGKKRLNQEDERKVNVLIEQIDYLKQLAPELFFSRDKEASYTPTPPRRSRSSKSRETSPAIERRESSLSPEDKQQEIQNMMLKLANTAEDLRRLQKLTEDEYERERIKRSMGMRRATSTEHENVSESRYKSYQKRKTDGSLHRKSLSLEHTIAQNDPKIWKNDNDSMSSLHSLDMSSDVERWTTRDTSLDSRLSGGSTQSEFAGEKKKKKGIMGKLKKLTKSRSIDDEDPGTFSPSRSLSSKQNSSSELLEEKGSKKDLRERITGIFKKSGSSSRSNSVERHEVRHDTSSTHRPLMRNGSGGNLSSRASPAFQEPEKTPNAKAKRN
ncbi:centromere-associated protein E isoform X3 [Tribolium castaneum]|uniref:centromere-associated protein E isoform X3 n=1 Tax=Tribolium castaneum TaxID=7070 RepID=UPI00077DE715|nr:PREDICTED: centromere-associated protein E isoform X3 [Tribolium castaneum]|eukprot:XP_015834246.1 PREDICTED: centromere-associated protein E isoform X3 [Tribolium castaneum]